MKAFSISNDIVPIAEFKTGISKWFKSIQKAGHPLIITQNGRPAGVLLSPSDYDELVYKKAFFDSVSKGISDAKSGKVYSTDELKAELSERRRM
ncbi:MAG: type II toxin-antitoxin system Phd/YefM family antitoxin [Deltaproteobacteria bacterium]|nr:type II toxin-antitoxin system Phd/YefM family antitoxin [Deltaproteobacteria bacterium]